jgi:hypothetical protein
MNSSWRAIAGKESLWKPPLASTKPVNYEFSGRTGRFNFGPHGFEKSSTSAYKTWRIAKKLWQGDTSLSAARTSFGRKE